MRGFGCAPSEGVKMAYHTSPDERIDDLCLQIQGEMDQHKLLQLIDHLDAVLDIKEEFLTKSGQTA